MTVPSEVNRSGPYIGNGVTTVFDYGFRIVSENHIRVIRTEDGIETILSIDADDIVSDVGNVSGGQIACVVAPTASQTITLLLNVPFTQETDLENQGPYFAETIENSLDLSVMRDQQLRERLDRALTIPASADVSDLERLVSGVLALTDHVDEIDTVAGVAGAVQTVAGIAADVTSAVGAVPTVLSNAEAAQQSADAAALSAVDAANSAAALANGGDFLARADAVSSAPPIDPAFIRFLSQASLSPSNGGQEWLGRKVGAVPAHDNYIINGNGAIYERVYAQPHTPASITELGCSPGGIGFDNGQLFNNVLIAARESGFTDWFVPPGAYHFNTRPAGNIDFTGFTLRGPQNQKVTLYKNFASSGTNDAILNFRGQGGTVSDMSLISLAGSQISNVGTGSLISIVSDATHTAGYINLSRLVLSGDASLVGEASTYFPLVVDGSLKNTAPHGVRSVMLQDVLIFGGEIGSAKINGAVHFYWHGGEAVLAGGKTRRIYIINDGSWGGVKSEDIRLSLAYADALTANNVNGANIDVSRLGGSIEDFTGCTNCIVLGSVSGAVSANARSGSNRVIDYKSMSNEFTVSGTASVNTTATAISFGVTFASAPRVQLTAVNGSAVYAFLTSVGTSSCNAAVSAGSGISVGWTATGRLA